MRDFTTVEGSLHDQEMPSQLVPTLTRYKTTSIVLELAANLEKGLLRGSAPFGLVGTIADNDKPPGRTPI